MTEIGSAKRHKEIDRVVKRTAKKISAELDKMIDDLPEDAATQQAFELVVSELAGMQPWLMSLIMEDPDYREAYAAAVARRPVTITPGKASKV